MDEAARAADDLAAIADGVGTDALRAASFHVRGIVSSCRGDESVARTLLEDGLDLFTRIGAPYEAAHARLDLSRVLERLGRAEDAERERRARRQRRV